MKKKKLLAILALSATLTIGGAAALAGCGHSHTYEEGWTTNETHHWHAATCDDKDELKIEDMKGYGAHVYDNDEDPDCNTCGYEREIVDPATLGTVTGEVRAGGVAVVGATVSINGRTTTTDSEGKFTITVVEGTELEITVTYTGSDPLYDVYHGTVTVVRGETTDLKIGMPVKSVPEIGKNYNQLRNETETSDKKDFKHEQNTAMWQTAGNVERGHGEGLCLHIDNNATKDDMESVVYEKFAITSANSKMMFRVRGFNENLNKSSLFAVRVADLTTCETTDLTPKNGNGVWQEIDSASYFTAYEYDLSAFEGKDVVIMIGAKQGQHCVIERIKFIGASENFLLPYATAAELAALEATDAPEALHRGDINDASWAKVGDQESAGEGWLFKDGPSAEEGSTNLAVFTYKKLKFDDTKTISVKARTFVGQTIPGKPDVPAQIVIKIFKQDGSEVTVNGNCYTIARDDYDTGYFSLGETLTGEYTFAIGIARGHRLAVDEIKFLDEAMTQGTITGAVIDGPKALDGVTVKAGSYSTTTGADGKFTLPVSIYGDEPLTITFEKDGYLNENEAMTVSASDFTDGKYDISAPIKLDKIIIGNITQTKIAALGDAVAAEDLNDKDAVKGALGNSESWKTVGGHNADAGEGFLFEANDVNNPKGSDNINTYAYKKLTLNGVKTIAVSATTFFGQNNVNGAGTVSPEIVIGVIDSDGNLITATYAINVYNPTYDTAYFTFDDALDGDYTFVIGVARGRKLAVSQILFKTEDVTETTVKGKVTDGTKAIAGATVSYAGISVTTDDNGDFELPVTILLGQTAKIKIHAPYGYEFKDVTVDSEEVTLDSNIVLECVKGLSKETVAGLEAKDAQSFSGVDAVHGAVNDGYWQRSGDVDNGHGEGSCIQIGENNLSSALYSKVNITAESQYLKISVREFIDGGNNRGGEMHGALQVKVIKEDGTVELVSLVSGGNTLYNTSADYTVGVFDLSAYVDQTVTIVIQAVDTLEQPIMANQHNAVDHIVFMASNED